MRKELRAFLALSAVVSAAAVPACAADFVSLRANVPFTFTAGEKTFPAGEYSVTEDSSHVLTIDGKGGTVLLMGRLADELVKAHSLSFRRTDKGIRLTGVGLSSSAFSVGKQ